MRRSLPRSPALDRKRLRHAEIPSSFIVRRFRFFAQYNRYATYTNAWKLIEDQYGTKSLNGTASPGANEEVIGVQVTIPLVDRARRQRALQTAAEATKSLHDAEFAQMNVLACAGAAGQQH